MSRRRKRNIPIPSFAAADDADADADDVNANVNVNVNANVNVNKKQGGSKRTKNEKNAARTTITATTSTSSRNSNRNASAAAAATSTSASTTTNNSETAEAISYLSSILKIETAMQLQQRRSTSTHAITSACISISMDKFIQIISKAMDVAGTHAMAMQLAAIYITIAQPALIQIQFTNKNKTDEISKLVKIDFTIGNRIQRLTQLYQTRWKQNNLNLNHDLFLSTLQQVSKMYSLCKQKDDCKGNRNKDANDILRLWTDPPADNDAARTSLHQSAFSNSNSNANSNANLSSMTLEQRIRAREEAKRVANAKETIASRQSSDMKQYAHLLPLADALNILLKRKNRAGTNAGSTSKCTWRPMPLKDVCKQLSGRSFRGVLNFRGMERMNAKDVKTLIGELIEAVPEWVHIVGGGATGTGTSKKDKKQKGVKMVVIKHGTNYQTVREKLAGRVLRNVEEGSTAVVNKKEEPTKLDSSQSNESIAAGVFTVTMKKPKQPTKKRKNTSDFVTMAQKQMPPARKPNKLSLRKRGNGIPIPGDSLTNRDEMIPSLAHASSNIDQEFSFGDSSDEGEASAGLRVNHNQHMTDADVSGGLTLQSNSTNPRGLKLMFGQLNAGERI